MTSPLLPTDPTKATTAELIRTLNFELSEIYMDLSPDAQAALDELEERFLLEDLSRESSAN